jgi:hypothetical protein
MRQLLPFLLLCAMLVSCTSNQKPAATDESKKVPEIKVINNGDVPFDNYFTDKTMRVDYYHSGTATKEKFAVDRIVSDGPWPGSKTNLTDKLGFGLYFFEVIDKATNILLYSRGFASIFGEWQTIPEADSLWGTFHESIRFPWPLKPVRVIMEKRDTNNVFQPIWTTFIDPSARNVNPADLVHTEKVDIIVDNGTPATKVDIVVLGDGYAQDEMEKFRHDAKRLSDVLLSTEPFKSRSSDINIRAVETPGQETGVTKPHPGVFRRTPLSVQYGSFGSERYALSFDNRTVRNVASAVPYDLMVILINEKTYGGGGIYNLYTTVSADNNFSSYIMVHEMGHHMAALADEYYTSSVAYEPLKITVEPWEANVTALFDKNKLKWGDLVNSDTPIPTPWDKKEFDAYGYQIQRERDSLRAAKVPEQVMEDLFRRQLGEEDTFFAKEKYRDQVGAFEGADYMAQGLYRPQLDCIMFTRHMEFCKVCSRTLEEVMDSYCK